MYGTMQPNYGTHNTQLKSPYPVQEQDRTMHNRVRAVPYPNERNAWQSVGSNLDGGLSSKLPTTVLPGPTSRTASTKQYNQPAYDSPIVPAEKYEQTKATALGKLLGLPIGAKKNSLTQFKSPFGSLW